MMLGGPWVDKAKTRSIIPIYLIPMFLAILLLSISNNPIVIFIYMSLMAFSGGLGVPLMGSLWAELYGVRNLGAIRALLHASMVFASALSPFLLGLVIDYNFGYFSIGLFCLILILCSSYPPFIFRNK